MKIGDMTMAIYCCKGCVAPKRHPACWDTCPEYLEEKAKHVKRKEELAQEQQISTAIYMNRCNKVEKAMRKRRTYKR